MAGSDSTEISEEYLQQLRGWFNGVDRDRNGHIGAPEVSDFLATALGSSLPGYRIREMITSVDNDRDGRISFSEFVTLFTDSRFTTNALRQAIERAPPKPSTSEEGPEPTTGGYSEAEAVAFAAFINKSLQDDSDARFYLPLNPNPIDEFMGKLEDGVLLCKMINKSVSNTVDERVLTKTPNLTPDTVRDNQRLVLYSAQAIGCYIVNIAPGVDMSTPHLMLGLLWQIIRVGLFANVKISTIPSLIRLLQEGETVEDLMHLSPEEMVLRWVNYHMQRAGSNRRITNFSEDIKDSEVYLTLIEQIAPSDAQLLPRPTADQSLMEKAAVVLVNATKIHSADFVTPKDILEGNSRLNCAFVANMRSTYPALPPYDQPDFEIRSETREELVFRNWMNSTGVNPYVNNLYLDLDNGLVLLQLFDKVQPGIVDWTRVHSGPFKLAAGGGMQRIENCNYVIELCNKLNFSVIGIGGEDIFNGNNTLTLAVVWQIMRAYLTRLVVKLSHGTRPIQDAELLNLINQKLETSGQNARLASFKDPTISDSMAILQLVEAIRPGAVNWSLVGPGDTDEMKLNRAKYALSSARKIGAAVHAFPEDIVEVKHKMMLTLFLAIAKVLLEETGSSTSF